MLRRQTEIKWKGTFEVCVRFEGWAPWVASKVGSTRRGNNDISGRFTVSSSTGSWQGCPRGHCRSWSVSEPVCSAQQLRSVFRPRLQVAIARLAS
jgi:hypothetical protein